MILFKKEFIDKILNGTKTETRRKGKKRWNVGAIHQLQLSWFDKEPFAKVEILSVEEQQLLEITEADAIAEGFKDIMAFWTWWEKQYGHYDPLLLVWVVKFKVVENLRDGAVESDEERHNRIWDNMSDKRKRYDDYITGGDE